MPPFAQLRVWLREGPPAEKVLAGVVLLIVLGLVSLALVPVYDSAGTGTAAATGALGAPSAGVTSAPAGNQSGTGGPSTASGPAAGRPTAIGSTSAGVGAASGSTAGLTGAAGAGTNPGSATGPLVGNGGGMVGPTASSGCAARGSGSPGVSPTQVHVDIAEVDLAGPVGDATFGIISYASSAFSAVTAYINKSGGVACGRKLVITQYKVNPVDSNDQQSKCLQMAQDGVLAVINDAGYVTPVSEECFVQNRLPLETTTSIGHQQGIASYPYLFSPLDSSEQQVRNGILGLAARGFFKAPKFSGKLGLFEDSCLPSANQEISQDLAASGVKPNQESTYAMDCALVGQPNQIEQAVLQNKLAGDTEVFLGTTISNDQNYIRIADQQNYHPAYLVSDYGSPTAPGQKWDPGFDGAVAVTSTRSGELDSGIHSPAETTCSNILVSNGLPAITTGSSEQAASVCDQMFFFAQAADHAGLNPTRPSLVEGLSQMGYFNSAYTGDSNWNRPGKIEGGDFQRAIRYHVSCQCWQVVDRSFGPGY